MSWVRESIDIIFGAGFYLITFVGFCLLQLSAVAYGAVTLLLVMSRFNLLSIRTQ